MSDEKKPSLLKRVGGKIREGAEHFEERRKERAEEQRKGVAERHERSEYLKGVRKGARMKEEEKLAAKQGKREAHEQRERSQGLTGMGFDSMEWMFGSPQNKKGKGGGGMGFDPMGGLAMFGYERPKPKKEEPRTVTRVSKSGGVTITKYGAEEQKQPEKKKQKNPFEELYSGFGF